MITAQDAREGRLQEDWRDDKGLREAYGAIRDTALRKADETIKLAVYRGEESVYLSLKDFIDTPPRQWGNELHWEMMLDSLMNSLRFDIEAAGYRTERQNRTFIIRWGLPIKATSWTPSKEEQSASACIIDALNNRN